MEENLQMQKNALGNMLGSDMHRWIHKRKKNEIRSVVKPINKRKLDNQFILHTQESQNSASVLSQLQSTPVVTDSHWNKENVEPADNVEYPMQTLHISYQRQESLLAGNKATNSPIKWIHHFYK